VMLEFVLVQGAAPHHITKFFDDRYLMYWPADTFDHSLQVEQCVIAVASRAALVQYRQSHTAIAQAYTAILQTRETEQRHGN
ncbi:MAG: hypothetical protein ABI901_12320, partial [Roseiflexaceae bacterium]